MMDVDFARLPHHWGQPPSVVTATFTGGAEVVVYISDTGRCFAVLRHTRVGRVASRKGAKELDLPDLRVMPQLGPVALEEKHLTDDTVNSARFSRLSSLHFRNELLRYTEHYGGFRELAASIWPGLKVDNLLPPDHLSQTGPRLLVRDDDYTAEIAQMGHGMQMWLQTAWFLAQAPRDSIVVLDEPDTYLHPDLQLRLMRLLGGTYTQTIISTHSVEIMTSVAPDEVVLVDRRAERSCFLDSVEGLETVAAAIGAPHNLQLVRLARSPTYLLVEGKDQRVLAEFQKVLLPDAETTIDTVPSKTMGGWGGWDYHLRNGIPGGKNAHGEPIMTYCIFDRDFHSEKECAGRHAEASEHGVHLVIWSRKEIENYLLVPSAISRAIQRRAGQTGSYPSPEEVQEKIESIAAELRETVLDARSDAIARENHGWQPSKCRQKAERQLSDVWKTFEGRVGAVPGKEALTKVKAWSQSQFGASLSEAQIIRAMGKRDVPREMADVVRAIVTHGHLPNPAERRT